MSVADFNYTSRWTLKEPERSLYITENDLGILKCLNRYRYLRSHFIAVLTGRKKNSKFDARLRELAQHGYLRRPHIDRQKLFIGLRGNLIYELAPKGLRTLYLHGRYERDPVAPLHPARQERSDRWGHSIMICDIIAGIEIGLKAADGRLITQKEITANPLKTPAIRIEFPGVPSIQMPLCPDALFCIELNGKRSYYALEADRDTESNNRSTFERTSYLRKILQYKRLLTTDLHKEHWGIPHLNVLNVTISETNMHKLLETTEQAAGASKSMLFAWHPHLEQRKSPGADGSMFTRPYLRTGDYPPYWLNK